MNYNHLRYFYTVAREGSIAKAAKLLHVTPQTISGQLALFEVSMGAPLFDRFGKRLVLNTLGKVALNYAEDIFALGNELKKALQSKTYGQRPICTVGVVDVIPKILSKQILETCISLPESIRLVVKEADFNVLLSSLAVGKIDIIFSDRPLSPEFPIKAYSHEIGASGFSFYIHADCSDDLTSDFPNCLDQYPFLMAGEHSAQKINLQSWFDQQAINPFIVGEFDDTALLKFFGQAGYGVFCTSSIIEQYVVEHYGVRAVGRINAIQERLYAVVPDRKMGHPGVEILINSARKVFSKSFKGVGLGST